MYYCGGKFNDFSLYVITDAVFSTFPGDSIRVDQSSVTRAITSVSQLVNWLGWRSYSLGRRRRSLAMLNEVIRRSRIYGFELRNGINSPSNLSTGNITLQTRFCKLRSQTAGIRRITTASRRSFARPPIWTILECKDDVAYEYVVTIIVECCPCCECCYCCVYSNALLQCYCCGYMHLLV